MPGLLLSGLNDGQRRFLNCLGYSKVPLFSACIGIILQILFNYIFFVKMNLGIMAIGLSGSLTNLCVYMINLLYPFFLYEIKDAIFFPNAGSFKGFKQYASIAIPSSMI